MPLRTGKRKTDYIDTQELILSRKHPIPQPRNNWRVILQNMQPGQHIDGLTQVQYISFNNCARHKGMRLRSMKINDDSYRVWRVK